MNKITTKVTVLYGIVNQSLSVTEKYEAVDSFYTMLYSDGIQASYLDDAGQPFYGTNKSHLLVNIPQYNESWAGEYSFVSYARCQNILQGCGHGHDFICYDLFSFRVLRQLLVTVLRVTVASLGKETKCY